MQAGVALLYLTFPVISESCCMKNHHRKPAGTRFKGLLPTFQDVDARGNATRGVQQRQHYRAVEGEMFMMPCRKSGDKLTKWFKTDEGKEGQESSSFDCKRKFVVEMKHSGNYNNTSILLTLQVVKKTSLSCFQPRESSVMLRAHAGGRISCPGLACTNNTSVVWYKENKAVSEQQRSSCEEGGLLQLCTVYPEDFGWFFCDRQMTEGGVTWTFRRPVNVTVVPHFEVTTPPEIIYPFVNETEEVKLGQSHTLTCKAYFDFEINVSRKVQWFMNYGGNMKHKTLLHMESPQENPVLYKKTEVIQRAAIREVTAQHLNHTYTCVAGNTVGNSSVTIRLKLKKQVRWPSLIGYPFACFLLVAGLGIIFHMKWLEIQIICRSRLQFENNREEKDFDVFLSHAWSPQPAHRAEGLNFISTSGLYSEAEACLSVRETLNSAETAQSPIEVLLAQVLEEQWGYRVCLLERDILPGGAYTNDVVLALKRSQMLVCVLSAEYLTDSNAVFVLESGVKALLQKSLYKLLLIWTGGTSRSLVQADPPLPKLVQRTLKVLPSLDWTSDSSSTSTCRFWTSLRKAMPDHRETTFSHTRRSETFSHRDFCCRRTKTQLI